GGSREKALFTLKREEFPEAGGRLRVTGRYDAMDARNRAGDGPAMTDETSFEGGKLQKYQLDQNQLREWGTVEVRGKKIHFEWSRKGKVSRNEEDLPENLVVPSTTVDFLWNHWTEILEGK